MTPIYLYVAANSCGAQSGSGCGTRTLLHTFWRSVVVVFAGALLLVCASGCVESEYPLSEPDNAVADAEILGLWRNAADETKKPYRIEPVNADGLPKGLMRAIVGDNPRPLFLWSTRIGDYAYLNIPCTDSSEKERMPLDGNNPAEYHKWRKSEKRPVLLMMVERHGDEMLVWDGGLESQRITGDRKETLAALARDPKKFFNGKPDRFARVSDVAVNGPKNAVTDEVGDEEPSREPPEWYKQRETPDPNMATLEIERLTPEQARQLVAEKNAEQFGDPYLVLGLTELDAETARQLAMFEGHTLGLPKLTKLDAKTANALAEFKGFIWLDGLTSLDPLTAKEIAGFRGDTQHPLIAESPTGLKGDTRNTLKLDGLKTLDANTAAALAKFEGRAMLLQGVTTLDSAAAESLAQFNGEVLYLTRLKLRDTNVAKALAHFKGKELHVQLPDADDAEIAKALAEFEGELPLLEPAVVTKVRSYRVRQDAGAQPIGRRTVDVASLRAMRTTYALLMLRKRSCEMFGMVALATSADEKGHELATKAMANVGGFTVLAKSDLQKCIAEESRPQQKAAWQALLSLAVAVEDYAKQVEPLPKMDADERAAFFQDTLSRVDTNLRQAEEIFMQAVEEIEGSKDTIGEITIIRGMR